MAQLGILPCANRSIGRAPRITLLDPRALNGAYAFEHGKAHFHRASAPRPVELEALLSTVITRVTRTLVRAGVLVAEAEQPYLDLAMDSPYEQLAGAAIRYVIAAGPQAGRATMRLQDPLLAVQPSGAFSPPKHGVRPSLRAHRSSGRLEISAPGCAYGPGL